MRVFKFCMVAAVVLAVGGMAQAAAIPFTQSWEGPVYMHINDYAMGTIYDPTGQPVDVWLPVGGIPVLASATGAQPISPGGPLETGWTIVQIDVIYKGALAGPNTINPLDLAHPLFVTGTGGKEVVALLHGRQDLFVKFNSDGSEDFMYNNDSADIYVQTEGTLAAETRTFLGLPGDGSGDPSTGIFGAAGSSGRFGPSAYVGIGYDSAGVAIPGALSLVLAGEEGYFPNAPALQGNPLYDPVQGLASFTFDPINGTGTGDADEFFSVIGGDFPYWTQWDLDGFSIQRTTGSPLFARADIRIHVTDSPVTHVGKFDWLLQSSDPVTSFVAVPEPLTATAILLAVGTLGGYIRRRRSA